MTKDDPTQGASTIAYAALTAIESGQTHVRLVNPLSDERLDQIEQEAARAQKAGMSPSIVAADLLLMIAEIRKGRTTR